MKKAVAFPFQIDPLQLQELFLMLSKEKSYMKIIFLSLFFSFFFLIF